MASFLQFSLVLVFAFVVVGLPKVDSAASIWVFKDQDFKGIPVEEVKLDGSKCQLITQASKTTILTLYRKISSISNPARACVQAYKNYECKGEPLDFIGDKTNLKNDKGWNDVIGSFCEGKQTTGGCSLTENCKIG